MYFNAAVSLVTKMETEALDFTLIAHTYVSFMNVE